MDASAGTAVLGGGPSGLACAWELARRGHPVVVLEREPRSGGLCATVEQDGYRFDFGGHRFVSPSEDLSGLVRELVGDDLLTRERRSVVLHHGRRFRYPLDALDLLRTLGLRENVAAFSGYFREKARHLIHPSPDLTFEDWVVARFGRPLYASFFGPYTEKLWGIPAARISADWAAQRIGLLDLGDAALRLVGLRRTPLRTYARRYLYPRYGMGQLFHRLAAEVERLGGKVLLGAEVTGLETAGTKVTAVRARANGGTITIPCRHLYATIPLPDLLRKLDSSLPQSVEDAAQALRFRALRFVNLMLRRELVSENTWMYVADPRYRIARIQEPKHRSPAMAPAGCTSLMLEIPCDVGDEVWSASDEAILPLVLGELSALGFSVERDVVGSFSARVAHGYPIYHQGYGRERDILLAHAARFDNVISGGRQGLFRYIFLDAAMEMGSVAARQILGGSPSSSAVDAVRRELELLEARAITA
jgi:protoporphyrinogen oxidase